MNSEKISPRANGFTLIELLTVIAIIGILAAIIIPTVGSVRRTAKRSRCIANHRQIATAYLLYLNDNKGRLYYLKGDPNTAPATGSGAMAGAQASVNTPGWLCRLLKDYGLEQAEWIAWKTPVPNWDKTVWYCPVSNETTLNGGDLRDRGCTYYYHYMGKWLTPRVTTDTPRVTLDQVSDFIATKPFLQDYYGNHQNPKRNTTPVWGSSEKWTKGVYTYLDGHVSYRQNP